MWTRKFKARVAHLISIQQIQDYVINLIWGAIISAIMHQIPSNFAVKRAWVRVILGRVTSSKVLPVKSEDAKWSAIRRTIANRGRGERSGGWYENNFLSREFSVKNKQIYYISEKICARKLKAVGFSIKLIEFKLLLKKCIIKIEGHQWEIC